MTEIEKDRKLIEYESFFKDCFFHKMCFTAQREWLEKMVELNWIRMNEAEGDEERKAFLKNAIDEKELLMIRMNKEYFKVDDEKNYRMILNHIKTFAVKVDKHQAVAYRGRLIEKLEEELLNREEK